MFPRYIFIYASKHSWTRAYRAHGVRRILMRSDDEPALLLKKFIDDLKASENVNGIIHLDDAPDDPIQFVPGQKLRVIRGQFEGLLAVFERHAAHGDEATVNMFGRHTRVVFSPDQLSADLRK